MRSTELQEKLSKAEERVLKIEGIIRKHEAQAAKKVAEIEAKGWDLNDTHCRYGTEEHHEAYWKICEYRQKIEDIRGAKSKLASAQQTVENWKLKLDKQLATEHRVTTEMPEAFRAAKEELVNSWTAADIKARDTMKAKKATLEREEFRKQYSYFTQESLNHTDEEFRKLNERSAELWILDLYGRVKAITGEVVDSSSLFFNGKALNGLVVGKNGTARVETIVAGGYNIQRLHYRVLVHEVR